MCSYHHSYRKKISIEVPGLYHFDKDRIAFVLNACFDQLTQTLYLFLCWITLIVKWFVCFIVRSDLCLCIYVMKRVVLWYRRYCSVHCYTSFQHIEKTFLTGSDHPDVMGLLQWILQRYLDLKKIPLPFTFSPFSDEIDDGKNE